ncbi:hypothetical protein LJC11_01625 [Bacteroidales bacterium OttesenSCG-928-I21]|nr:hypothetical protein [Bacteroidales bacterium OttesenSCG-928-I21]
MTENLFLNTLAFEFPKEPKTFYFSDTDCENVSLTKLSHQLFPFNIQEIFPHIKNSDTLYTSFEKEIEGFKPLLINFSTDNFALVKRYYNREIKLFFSKRNFLVEPTFIKDNQVWLRANDTNTKTIKDCIVYDRFTLKINFNHFTNTPELVLSYDRQAKVYKKSVAAFLSEHEDANEDIFAENTTTSNPSKLLNKVVYVQYVGKDKKRQNQQVFKYSKLCEFTERGEQVDYNNVFPIINNDLGAFLGYETEEENNPYLNKNRYTKYIPKIFGFKKKFLEIDEFKSIIPIVDDFTSVTAGTTNRESKKLIFGKGNSDTNVIDVVPQRGVNNGPFSQPRHNNIQLFFIVPNVHKQHAQPLLEKLRNGYKLFKGLSAYLGIHFTTANGFSIVFDNINNPIPEIETKIYNRIFDPNVKYLAIYLTPVSKHAKQKEQRTIYYKVKELLLKWNIASQCIETDKMQEVLNYDSRKNAGNFAYTLQNIAIAINAKLGGTPWRIAVPLYRELIVGVGAFKHTDINTQYIGSAFSFDNTGTFNSFEYFQKDELLELAGSIEEAIIQYKNTIQKPERLIIHYYKDMREDEVEVIENTLFNLNLDIPVFVVTINKTESEDIIVFDDNFNEKMPYSGRFVNLGNNTYLLCNNTRYENDTRKIEGFPFPVKLKIKCPSDHTLLNPTTINGLIDQVYQFSRIYWKSVKQQNLPVTIKYPEMVAQIAPYFSGGAIPPNIGKDNLWFL